MNNPLILNRRLQRLMEETHIYTEPHINRRRVAHMIYTNEMYLHNTIRRYYGCAFTHYIVRLRIQHAMQMLQNPQYNNLSIEAIALDAGFGSRFTFHRLFKEYCGITPDGFRKRINTSKQ
ncbi:helix-turn-helix transcriptional regulator [Bacteroides sp. 519]|uniref:helix-turn-helix transcriptional regulator n=1 Tax=Bacteroides sp. 519 TaxID=2302937 RepID=UPI0013D81CD2|nr:helix-turn-helix transcriptional regulator [Bacteroides sp. 519]NDV56963.1 AraC family transcriptional regulator [Bacteroides sp. 519]